jgi:hypothetical protein
MSDTPETDAEHAQFPMGGFTLDFARKLERELTEALSDLEFRRDLFKLQEQQLNDVRAERDRLAEVLERILSYQGRFCEEDPESIAAEALAALKGNDS